ncbi:unnamed protein product [Fraxinus pennsylvanica]|uniref:Uncharacterized protein n=1 Tax=Fraxinus pennsylvanica TaxID=56036 RepID=A0AAD2E2I3_9LAMI|nr:unnamed protein product [Fraxinus pennsylvanica]
MYISTNFWYPAMHIPNVDVLLDEENLEFAKVVSQADSTVAYTIWNREFALSDYLWSKVGNICKHVIQLLEWNNDEKHEPEFIKEKCEIKDVLEDLDSCMKNSFDVKERKAFLKKIGILRSQFKSCAETPANKSTDRLRSSLLLQSI